jgi:hypothetical protein
MTLWNRVSIRVETKFSSAQKAMTRNGTQQCDPLTREFSRECPGLRRIPEAVDLTHAHGHDGPASGRGHVYTSTKSKIQRQAYHDLTNTGSPREELTVPAKMQADIETQGAFCQWRFLFVHAVPPVVAAGTAYDARRGLLRCPPLWLAKCQAVGSSIGQYAHMGFGHLGGYEVDRASDHSGSSRKILPL